jgi:hypothetical protein
MRVRFQADADLNMVILSAVVRREPAIDFQTAVAAALTGLNDREALAVASREGRVLVTHDQRTMPHHFAEFITSGTSAGVLVIPQHLAISAAVEELLVIWGATDAEEWIDRICYLPL